MRPVKQHVPLMSFAIFFVMASAALSVGQTKQESGRRVIASGRLLGSREVQRISVFRTNGVVGLVIESTSPSTILWRTNSNKNETKIDSVRIEDLDGDDIPEILTLWWKGPSAVLRVFHWDIHQRDFAEISSDEEINKVRSYRVERKAARASARLVVASNFGPTSGIAAREYELRNSRLVRTAGGLDVNTTGESGIEGQAMISPSHPGPVRQGESGTAPYKTTLVIWNASDGREVTRVETGSDGRFRVVLKPGTYRVGSPQQTGRFLPRGNEETVTVTAGKFAKLTLNFDSGMR